METARHHICIYHEILIGLARELHRQLPLQCNSEFTTREKSNSSAIICARMVGWVSVETNFEGTKSQSELLFLTEVFCGRLRGMSVPNACLFQEFDGLTEVLGRMSAGTSS